MRKDGEGVGWKGWLDKVKVEKKVRVISKQKT